MSKKQLKYSEYLTPIKNCPPVDCIERVIDAFRWVHATPSANDFIPLPLMTAVERRPLDSTDLNHPCEAYALSFWADRDKAVEKLIGAISRQPPPLKAQYIESKGDCVAHLKLTNEHGVASESNKRGHISLFEYKGVQLHSQIIEIINIFKKNG